MPAVFTGSVVVGERLEFIKAMCIIDYIYISLYHVYMHTPCLHKPDHPVRAATLSDFDHFSKFFHRWKDC